MKFLEVYLKSNRVKKTLNTRPGQEGFSLVELVVVIAVLAILSAVAIPAFQGVQARAKTSALKNGLVNGIKECIVSDGLDEGTTFAVSRAFAGNYTGYTVQMRNGTENTCYMVQAVTTDVNLPWFILEYNPLTGVSTKTCQAARPIGCKADGTW